MNYHLIIQACQAQIAANELWYKFAGDDYNGIQNLNKLLVMVIGECDKPKPNDERVKKLLGI